ncbi:helix-turn-helix domain-containing protein [Clostridium sp. P21]|uniref:Helix-turn-helix domain-containing protein n=1 Tax=Clostridium muellerianum TaxID=2716538 RepID=A0A7Y0EFV9_9CLOT|nr:helix-turn-helix domain-containing protein [Clostridium muellerianum]NMM62739.1 helix-turn-helix domain-containing protein [Clostridium muellerianum]
MATGATLRAVRKKIGLKQYELAEKYKISVRTLQDWELEVRIPPDYILNLLLTNIALDFGVDEVTRDTVCRARQTLESED